MSLSEQNLVDWDVGIPIVGNHGCKYGLAGQVYKYVEKHGLCTEEDYAHTAKQGTCDKSCKAAVKISKWKQVPFRDEDALKAAVAQQPVAATVAADKKAFQLYKSGVLTDADGCGYDEGHEVLVVGYGTDNGTDYWKVKNSWGTSWGEDGYIRLERNTVGTGMCGIASQAVYPVV